MRWDVLKLWAFQKLTSFCPFSHGESYTAWRTNNHFEYLLRIQVFLICSQVVYDLRLFNLLSMPQH